MVALVAFPRKPHQVAGRPAAPEDPGGQPPQPAPPGQDPGPGGKPPRSPGPKNVDIDKLMEGYVPPPAGGEGPPPRQAADPVWASLGPDDQARVEKAVARGVAFLKDVIVKGKGKGDPFLVRVGGQALAGLTLLSCDVPADDPAVRRVTEQVRGAAKDQWQTYDLALAVLFLDRLGEPDDRDLIRTLALRLIGGQLAGGGWSYQCTQLKPEDYQELQAVLEGLAPGPGQFALGGDGRPAARLGAGEVGALAGVVGNLPLAAALTPEKKPAPPKGGKGRLNNVPVLQYEPGTKVDPQAGGGGDNSNTQFAVLAVWVARKYGVSVERTMSLVEAHCQAGQNDDGSFAYSGGRGQQWPDSMTCSGLLGLAVGRGAVYDDDGKARPARDPHIDKGLRYLAEHVVGSAGKKKGASGRLLGLDAHGDLYCLWSLERVAVAYDLQTFGGKEWYSWGVGHLLRWQAEDGSWSDIFAKVPDTCFALLFLKRANVARDLTDKLKSFSDLVDRQDLKKGPGGGPR
jgi:hypothetical protein